MKRPTGGKPTRPVIDMSRECGMLPAQPLLYEGVQWDDAGIGANILERVHVNC